MKRISIAVVLCLAALPVWADETDQGMAPLTNIICIGPGACSMATAQKCSVALGKNVQFPNGLAGDHVLVTQAGVMPLLELDDITVERINAEMGKLRSEWHLWESPPRLDPAYVREWNRTCGAVS